MCSCNICILAQWGGNNYISIWRFSKLYHFLPLLGPYQPWSNTFGQKKLAFRATQRCVTNADARPMSSSVHFISEANPPNPSQHHGYSKEPFPSPLGSRKVSSFLFYSVTVNIILEQVPGCRQTSSAQGASIKKERNTMSMEMCHQNDTMSPGKTCCGEAYRRFRCRWQDKLHLK